MNIFKFYPLEYKRLKGIDRGSKLFRREISLLQAKFAKYILWEFFHNKENQIAVRAGKKYRLALIMCAAYLLTGVGILTYAIILIGDNISKQETGIFMILMAAVVLSLIATFIFAGRSGKVRSEYLTYLFDSMPDRRYSFDEKMLQEVANAFFASHKEQLSEDDKCVCYRCKTKFSAEKVKMDEEGRLFCPVCEWSTVLTESSGFSFEDGFTDAMKEYWLEE